MRFMNITKKVTLMVSGAALAGLLALGASASAAGPASGADATLHPRAAYVCTHQSEISDRLANAKTRIDERIATLTDRRAQAEQAGHSAVVTRIDKRLQRLNNMLDRVTVRATQLPVWVAAHCGPAS